MSDTNLSELDRRLQELALTDFAQFCKIAGVDKKKAAICLSKKTGKSYGQIAKKMGMPRQSVVNVCKKCD